MFRKRSEHEMFPGISLGALKRSQMPKAGYSPKGVPFENVRVLHKGVPLTDMRRLAIGTAAYLLIVLSGD